MPYIEIDVTVAPSDPFSDLLKDEMGEIGFESFMDNISGFLAYIPLAEFSEKQLASRIESFENQFPVKISYTQKTLPDENWNAVWEANYEPVTIGDFCFVHAPFHPVRDDVVFNIEIQPAMSFGTAHHPTTHLMLELLNQETLTQKSVMDMGCGTGILAIFAAKSGAAYVEAIDIDEHAFCNSHENKERNNVPQIVVKQGDVFTVSDRMFDVYLANIHRNILVRDMAEYVRHLAPKGKLLLSGFFENDILSLDNEAQKYGLTRQKTATRENWAAVQYIKN